MLCAAQWLSGTSEKPAVPAAPTLSVSSSASTSAVRHLQKTHHILFRPFRCSSARRRSALYPRGRECPQCVVIIWESGAKSNLCFALCAFLTALLTPAYNHRAGRRLAKTHCFQEVSRMDKERARRLFLTAFFPFRARQRPERLHHLQLLQGCFSGRFRSARPAGDPARAARCCGRVRHRRAPLRSATSRSRFSASRCTASACSCSALFLPGLLLSAQLFVFTYSLGDHMVMPIRDAIAMDLADEGKGTFLGRYRGMMTLGSMLASALVFVGFRVGFSISAPESSLVLRCAGIPHCCARPSLPPAENAARVGCAQAQRRAQETSVRRRYLPYYIIVTAVYGFQSGCALSLLRGSSSSFSRWARTMGGAARHRRLFLRRLGRPRSSESF